MELHVYPWFLDVQVYQSNMEIYHQYVKLRRHFGRWPKVVDEGAEMIADVRPNEEHAERYIERCPVTTCAQVIPDMSEHDANTNEVLYSKHNINHEEGGWPKDVDYTEAEHTIRFRKKVEKDEDYIKTVVGLGKRAEARAMQNNAIDIYQQYYTTGLTDVVAQACPTPSKKPLFNILSLQWPMTSVSVA